MSEPRTSAREINQTIRYTMWSAFRLTAPLPAIRDAIADEVETFTEDLAAKDVVTRGWYDLRGMRAETDLMVWWHAADVESLQAAYGGLLATALGGHLEPFWSNVGLHRPAEFNRGHVPAFMSGEPAGRYLCLYPFVRSYEWYLIPEEERRAMLVEHGQMGREYEDVRANTVSAFALGDYEWLLAFEAEELHRIVDLMRHLRGSQARRHVREEIPFFTGPLITPAAFVRTR